MIFSSRQRRITANLCVPKIAVEEKLMSTTPMMAPEAPQAPAPINHFGRIIGVFFSPKATFEDIARRPSWAIPVALMTILGIGVAFVMNQKVDWRDVASRRIEESPRAANLSAEQKEQQIAMGAKISPGIAYGFGVAWPILQALIVGGILLLAYNVIGGADARFGTSLGIPRTPFSRGFSIRFCSFLFFA
jgi:hypothetical protein